MVLFVSFDTRLSELQWTILKYGLHVELKTTTLGSFRVCTETLVSAGGSLPLMITIGNTILLKFHSTCIQRSQTESNETPT